MLDPMGSPPSELKSVVSGRDWLVRVGEYWVQADRPAIADAPISSCNPNPQSGDCEALRDGHNHIDAYPLGAGNPIIQPPALLMAAALMRYPHLKGGMERQHGGATGGRGATSRCLG